MMNYCEKFNELPWHDSALLNVEIDRKMPGEKDCVKILVKWPSGDENFIVFNNCYLFEAKMNFGVVAEESILSAICTEDNNEIASVRSKWSPLGVELGNLLCYTINTNSTNSSLKVFALSMDVA
jgi:hypothetical protein